MSPRPPYLRFLRALAAVVVVTGAACAPEEASTISRETFIEVFVELRIAALDRDDADVPSAERDRILGEHGITADDMVTFAEVRGRDTAFMAAVWNEIEQRLSEDPTAPDPSEPDSTEGE